MALPSPLPGSARLLDRACVAAYAVAWLIVLPGEVLRWHSLPEHQRLLLFLFSSWNLDTTPFVLPLLLAPACWWWSRGTRRAVSSRASTSTDCKRAASLSWHGLTLLLGVGALAWWSWGRVSAAFGELPPAYHDEYSYLFQARTYLAGRVTFPSTPPAGLFDQMHVLNDGQYASRYFPGTGAWLAPFLAMERPYLGYRVATALCALLVAWVGTQLAGWRCGVLAGALTAVSPGLLLFGNLLLAHQPTLVGWLLFFGSYLRAVQCWQTTWQNSAWLNSAWLNSAWLNSAMPVDQPGEFETQASSFRQQALRGGCLWSLVAGAALGYAGLCRPMTAFGLALPCAGHWWWQLFQAWRRRRVVAAADVDSSAAAETKPSACLPVTASAELKAVPSNAVTAWCLLSLGLVMPLLAAGGLLMLHNRAITGSIWLTPYQQYTNIYTPRHGYGFNNVIRGEQHLGPKVIDNYDRWAENLTPVLAAKNVGNRLLASWQWTLGVVPLSLATVVGLALWRQWSGAVQLVFAAIVSLHVVHIPYWFDGIMHWHYVYESAPLWLLWGAIVLCHGWSRWQEQRQSGRQVWSALCLLTAIVVGHFSLEGLWLSRLTSGIQEVAFARHKHARFQQLVQQRVHLRPALVLIKHDPADRHIDYVNNLPTLDADLLLGRYPADSSRLDAIGQQFPHRHLYLYDVAQQQLLRLP